MYNVTLCRNIFPALIILLLCYMKKIYTKDILFLNDERCILRYTTLLTKVFSVQTQNHISKWVVCYVKDSAWYCDCDYNCCFVYYMQTHHLIHHKYYLERQYLLEFCESVICFLYLGDCYSRLMFY